MNAIQKQKLRKFIKELEGYRGRHTELVSVYIPAGYDLNKIIQHLQEEQGTASNIKDKNTRNNVIDSLEKMIRHLRLFKRTPENGLAIFSGNASVREDQTDIRVWSIEPPQPINTRLYRCDQTFVLDLLKEILTIKETFGLVVIDNREANIGLLRGTLITEIADFHSQVPGKTHAGGQCLNPETLVMLDNGNIIKIKDIHNPNLIVSENFNLEKSEVTPVIARWSNKKELFKIVTKYPTIDIEASADHTFFVRNSNGIEEKSLSEIKVGDFLIMPEKIDLILEDQKINFVPSMKRKFKQVTIPEKVNPDFARILGYYLGDGSHEIDRITFFEQREQVAEHYKELIERVFSIKVDMRFRASKNYYQIRIYSRVVSQLLKDIFYFNKKNKTFQGKIPEIILKSSDTSLAAFILGLFDAEGYISRGNLGFGVNNKTLTKQLNIALLRLGIISSVLEYDNRRNPYSKKIRYTLQISDTQSLKRYYNLIGFTSIEKYEKLKKTLKNRSNRTNVRQLVVNGKEIAKILRNSGIYTTQFRNPGFFVNKRQMSKEIFKITILDKIKNEDLKKRLYLFYNSNLILTKIVKIQKIGLVDTVDIETKNHNFIANGLIVHNSAQRFAALREVFAKDFYNKVAEAINREFLSMKQHLKGIIVGGPGPTKETFVSGNYINNELKKKILGVKDLSYTGEFGLNELVDKSQDLLAKEEVTKEKQLVNRFFEMLARDPDKTAYGKTEVDRALGYGAVDTLILSDFLQEELLDYYEKKAQETGAKLEVVSTETKEGMQIREIGGIVAILRFALPR